MPQIALDWVTRTGKKGAKNIEKEIIGYKRETI